MTVNLTQLVQYASVANKFMCMHFKGCDTLVCGVFQVLEKIICVALGTDKSLMHYLHMIHSCLTSFVLNPKYFHTTYSFEGLALHFLLQKFDFRFACLLCYK